MAGIFGPTPEEVRLAERQRAAQAYGANPNSAMAAALFNLGNAAGGAMRRGIFGEDTTSLAVRKAQEEQAILQGVDTGNYDSVMALAARLSTTDPNKAMALTKYANDNLNVFEDEVEWIRKEGVLLPRIVSKDKKGNRQIKFGAGIDTYARINRAAAARATPAKHTSTGRNITLKDGSTKAVYLDGNGVAYIRDPSKVSEDNPIGANYDAVTMDEGGLFSANEERAPAGATTQKAFRAIVLNAVKKAEKDKNGFWNFLVGKSEDEMKDDALRIASIAEDLWSTSNEIQKQYGSRVNFANALIVDYYGDRVFFPEAIQPVVEEEDGSLLESNKVQGGGPAGAGSGGINPKQPPKAALESGRFTITIKK